MIKTFFPKKSVHLILIFPICIILSCKPATISGQRITTVSQGAYNPSISPDGSTIAVGILGKIWLLPVQGGDAKQLTFGKSWDHHPVWSRSGNTLTYVQDSPNSSEIVYYNFSTGTSRTLHARSPAEHIGSGSWGPVYSIGDMSFHPTNGRLYYVDFRSGIWSIEPNNPRNNPEQLLSGSVRVGRPGITEFSSFSFSPNGESIVVVKDTTDLWTHIQTISINDSTLSRLTPLDKIKHSNVRWNRDGTSIIYIEQRGGTEILVKQNVKNPMRYTG